MSVIVAMVDLNWVVNLSGLIIGLSVKRSIIVG
jgi:hypothetical protein